MNSGFVAGRLSHSRFLPAYRNFEFDSPWEGTNYIDQQSKENDKEK